MTMGEPDRELLSELYHTQKVTTVSENKFVKLSEDKFNLMSGLCDTNTIAILVQNDLGENTKIPKSIH